MRIPFDSDRHQEIIMAIKNRVDYSRSWMGQSYPRWKRANEMMAAYTPTTAASTRATTKRTQGEDDYTRIIVPLGYANVSAALVFLQAIFLNKQPVFQYRARKAQWEQGKDFVEAAIAYQYNAARMALPLTVWFKDALRYGVGIIGQCWKRDGSYTQEEVMEPLLVGGMDLGLFAQKKKVFKPSYEGCHLYNVSPFEFFPDPTVPLGRNQDGEFNGRLTHVGRNHLIKQKKLQDWFNVEVVLDKFYTSSILQDTATGWPLQSVSTEPYMDLKAKIGPVELLEFYIRLIPKEWGLGASTWPEMWLFVVAGGRVLVDARKYEAGHDGFPFVVVEPDSDGHAFASLGICDRVDGLEHTLNWLVNTHFYSIRQILDGTFIVDPSRVEVNDFNQKGPGRVIRLRPSAYGSDIKQSIQQLPVTDVTQQHMNDTSFIYDMVQRITGISNNNQSAPSPGSRNTATEMRAIMQASGARMSGMALNLNHQGWAPLAEILLSESQRWYDSEMEIRIAGGPIERNDQFVTVNPENIQGEYDFVPVDGTLPVDNFAQGQQFLTLMQLIGSNPVLQQQYDQRGLAEAGAKLMGADIKQFRVQVRPEEAIQNALQSGELQQMGGGNAAKIPGFDNGGAAGANEYAPG